MKTVDYMTVTGSLWKVTRLSHDHHRSSQWRNAQANTLGHPWTQPGDSRPSQLGGEKACWNLLWVKCWRRQCVSACWMIRDAPRL